MRSLKSTLLFLTVLFCFHLCNINTKADDNALKLYQLCKEYSFTDEEADVQKTNASDNNNQLTPLIYTNSFPLGANHFHETSDKIFLFSNSQIISISKLTLEKVWSFEIPGKIYFVESEMKNPEFLNIYSKEIGEIKKNKSGTSTNPSNNTKRDNTDIYAIITVKYPRYIITTLSSKTGIPVAQQKFFKQNQPEIFLYDKSYVDQSINVLKTDGSVIFFLNPVTNHRIWEFKTGGEISDYVALEDRILIGSFDNFLYSIKKKTGKSRWKKRFSSRINKLFSISSGVIGVGLVEETEIFLISENGGKDLGRIKLKKSETPFKISFDKNYGFFILSAKSLSLYIDKSENPVSNCDKKAV